MHRATLLAAAAAGALTSLVIVVPLHTAPPNAKVGLTRRVPCTTSRITGTPEAPPPYRTERVFPGLRFDQPVTLTRAPGSERLFVAELGGRIYSFPDDAGCTTADLFLDLGQVPGHYRTYGLVFHPAFARNRQIFVCYVLKGTQPQGTRVARFRVTEADPPRADPRSEEIVLEWPSGGHNGGCLQFGPDGCLYISTGDGSNPSPPDALDTGQDLGDLLAAVLRIDVDRPAPGQRYAVPADNPFVQTPGARPEIWAYGFRNPWKMAFDPRTGELWLGDVGWEMWEMVYRVERGGNYGWSVVEGPQPVRTESRRGPTPILPPTVAHPHIEARSLTGGRVYRGSRLPALAGAYVYGDYVTGKVWGLRHDGSRVTWQQHLADSAVEIVDFGEDAQGELYLLDHGGTLQRLVPDAAAQANRNFPRRLSETGLFASVAEHVPAPGVLPYSINAEPWADHAVAERLVAIPGTATLGVYEKQNLQIGHVKGAWIYPTDTVFARTVTLELERGNPASRRRLETQVLHQDRGTWRAYNYLWNDEQTDAVLAEVEGSDRTFTVRQGERSVTQTWHFSSRTECLVCHTTRAGSILGFNIPQLNRDRTYGDVQADQLATLAHLGLFAQPLPNPLPRLPSPWDPGVSLEQRARAYLHTNCAHCHRRGGGGTAPFELLYDLDLKKTFLVGTRATQGTFDIHAAENVAAGDPYRSVLYYRMAKLGPGRMPQLGSGVVDERGLDLVHEWIARLGGTASGRPHPASVTEEQHAALGRLAAITGSVPSGAVERLLASPSGALYLLRALDTGKVPEGVRGTVVAAARQRGSPAVRDLFERFVPEEERVRRLGSAAQPAAILALPGDAARGRELFLKGSGVACRNCHRVGPEGQEVGPDLTRIGSRYDRSQLLESILEPSRRVDPAYVTYLAETTRGTVYTGLLVQKTATEVVLRDAQGKLVTLAAKEVETLAPQQKSLMPDLLLRDLTARDVADLLAFLASLK